MEGTPGAGRWLLLCALAAAAVAACAGSTIPDALSDRDWWALIETLSEPPGAFELSDNFVSNEPDPSERARWLARSGGAYIGVGPEQNFTYVAAARPEIAFVLDIRRENLAVHLLYKALFELSDDRADFLSQLFSRPRPAGLARDSGVNELFRAFERVPRSFAQLAATRSRVRARLLGARGVPLRSADLEWIDRALQAFFDDGPDVHFWGSRTVEAIRPSYRELMTAPDGRGVPRSFLATEALFHSIRDLHSRNLIVPVVGDFSGTGAMRRIGDYVRQHRSEVTSFYASNVTVHLNNLRTRVFCRNLASLPTSSQTLFIDSKGVRTFDARLDDCPGAREPD